MSQFKITKSEKEWQEQLTEQQYCILRNKATEPPFSGAYNGHKETGMYLCAGCRTALFNSDAKFESGTGWPSFFRSETEKAVTYRKDNSHGMERVEVLCANCGGHLGHIFDHPTPTGKRFCINSGALVFDAGKASKNLI